MRAGCGLIVTMLGCGPVVVSPEAGAGAETTDTAGETVPPVETSGGTEPMPGATAGTLPPATGGTTGAAATDSGEDGTTVVHLGDQGPDVFTCDVWEQDCPEGEKCTLWSGSEEEGFNATRCAPVVDDPAGPGEPCVLEGGLFAGIDDCDATSMCWSVDEKTLEGTCHAFCTGDESDPQCGPTEICHLSSENLLTVCLPHCDPFAQDCPATEGCYPWEDCFVCAPDFSDAGGTTGDPCDYVNQCDPGTMCIAAEYFPDCASTSCCSPYCTLGDDTPCADAPGTTCEPIYDDPSPTCSTGTAGVCASVG